MPLKKCRSKDSPGYKWGDEGTCYTYTPNDAVSRMSAKKKAIKQGVAIEGPKKFSQIASKLDIDEDELGGIIEGVAEELTTNIQNRDEKLDALASFLIIEKELTKAAARKM